MTVLTIDKSEDRTANDFEFVGRVCLWQASVLRIAPSLVSEAERHPVAQPQDWYVLGSLVRAIECDAWRQGVGLYVLELFGQLSCFSSSDPRFLELWESYQIIKRQVNDSIPSKQFIGV